MENNKFQSLSNRIALEFTGERYVPEIEGQIALEHLHRYALACVLAEGKQVLDIASGEGYGSHLLAKVAKNVIGVDISEEAIHHAKTKYKDSKLDFRTGSATSIPVESNSVDLVVSFETIEHLAEHEEMLNEIKRVLKSDGVLIISSPNKQNYSIIPSYMNPYHVKELFRDEFENLLGRYFRNCNFSGQRIVYGSWIFPYGASREGATYFEPNHNSEITSSVVPSIYEIGIASDVFSPMMGSSFLNQQIEKSEIVKSLNEHLGERDKKLARLNDKLKEQNEGLSTFRQELVDRDGQINSLNQAVSERNTQIARLNQAMNERNTQIARLNQAVSERNTQIARLNQAMNERNTQVAGLYQTVAELKVQIADLLKSRSWQLTRPLRWCSSSARRLRSSLLEALRLVYCRLPLPPGQRAAIRAWYYCRSGVILPGLSHQFSTSAPETVPPNASPFTRAAMAHAPVRILLIERAVPMPNQDAGSMMIYSFIRVFRDLGHAVTFFPVNLVYDPDYTPALQSLGVICLHAPEVHSLEEHLAAAGASYDIILACRPDYTDAIIPLLRANCPKARLLYETHDLHFVRQQRQAEVEQCADLLTHARWRKEQELRIAAAVDCTIVVSEKERQTLLQENPNLYVEVIPVVSEFFGCGAGFAERRDMIFIGGYKHLPNVDAVVYFVREILPLIKQQRPEIRLHVVGAHPPAAVTSLASDNVIVHGFVPDITELMNQVKISVNPLRFGAGIKGKIITSMSYGVPCIGTSIAIEGMEVVPGNQALIANTPEEFTAAVLRLYSDQPLWEHMSAASMALARQYFSLDVAAQGFTRIFNKVLTHTPRNDLQLERITSQEAYQKTARKHEQQRRQAIESALAADGEPIIIQGFCFVCSREVAFHTDFMYSFLQPDGSHIPNWRERGVCPECRLNNRMRAAIHLFHLLCAPTPESHLYLTEQSTPLFALCQRHYPHVIGSEYLGDILPAGAINCYGIRNESLTALSFFDNQFDAILSFDVIEHIPDYLRAFQECLRCLKPGGAFFFSIPFDHQSQHHIVRAKLDEAGKINHLLPPEYHGDPINPDGCLCFYHFGWELLDQLRSLGFQDVAVYFYWSQRFGYLGGEQLVFRAVK
jgi:ubiquinone/menaquinone biosynthesis C-methylase UbiE/glycosyltransferase involved in cell wall biosynthesis